MSAFQVDWNPDKPCSISEISLCRLGDLTRHGALEIAGRKLDASRLTRRLFTDMMLPLSGSHSLFGKSLVIYDDHGPVARGDRLACSMYVAQQMRINQCVEFYHVEDVTVSSVSAGFTDVRR